MPAEDELREQLRLRGLETGGTTSEMQERLLSAMLAEQRKPSAAGQSAAKRPRNECDRDSSSELRPKPKVFTFNDAVHGHITLPAVCVAVMDTPQFQRLKDLKQLGGVYYAYSCASHNRFEHSIGTAHLGGKIASRLREIQPELGITDADILCVQLAGLCHDLGHGPCSHMFEHFLETAWEAKGYGKPPSHEFLSTQLLDYLIKENDLMGVFKDAGLTQRDITFVKEMIDHPTGPDGKVMLLTGRDADKHWLAQIISNERCGIDVDKFDYFMRDARQLGIACGFDPNRLMLFTRVMRAPENDVDCGQRVLAFKESEAWNIYELFHARYTLHKRAYQHRTANGVETMLCEVLALADDHVQLPASDEGTCSLSASVRDMAAYSKLSDSIFKYIELRADLAALEDARLLLYKIHTRQLHRYIGESVLSDSEAVREKSKRQWQEECATAVVNHLRQLDTTDDIAPIVNTINATDLEVQIVKINYGKGAENPVDHCLFYGRDDESVATKIRATQVSAMIPTVFEERYLRLYSRNRDERLKPLLRQAFEAYRREHPEALSAPTPLSSPVGVRSTFVEDGRGGAKRRLSVSAAVSSS